MATTIAAGVPLYSVPDKHHAAFEEHLPRRLTQKYGSTSRYATPERQRAALTGECCLHDFLKQEPDFRNKPKGDRGADAVVRLLVKQAKRDRELWMDLDVKTSLGLKQMHVYLTDLDKMKPGQRVRFEPMRIYVCAWAPDPDHAQLLGWMWGWNIEKWGTPRKMNDRDMVKRPTVQDQWAWHIGDLTLLQPMAKLQQMILNSFHHDDPRLTRLPLPAVPAFPPECPI